MTKYTREMAEAEFLAQLDEIAPVVEWDDFISDIFEWKQSQHIGIIGPTGMGKSNLSTFLLSMRKYVVAFATKPRDETIELLAKRDGFVRFKTWQDRPARYYPRRVIWPDSRELESQVIQHREIKKALSHIYVQGNWCVFIDELWYMINILGLAREVKIYLLQARSNGISLVGCSQRPAWIPVEMFDQPDHLFFFRDNDERNLKTISGISWLSATMVRSLVARLEMYQFLYINTRSGVMWRSMSPPPPDEEGGDNG